MYCTYWYTVWPHCQVGSAKRTKIDVLISGMALCHTVFQQLSATALVRGHLQVWVSLPLCAWKATKKNNSLLWIHLTAVLTPGGKFSRLCSQEDAVSEPWLAWESIADAGQHMEAWEPAETSPCSDLGWPHFPAPPSEAALRAELLYCCWLSEAGAENPCEQKSTWAQSAVAHSCPTHSRPAVNIQVLCRFSHPSCGQVETACTKHTWTAPEGSAPMLCSSPGKPLHLWQFQQDSDLPKSVC